MSEPTKVCSKCKQEKPFSAYYKEPRKAIGIRCSCKDCNSASTKGRKLSAAQLSKQSAKWATREVDPKKLRAKNLLQAAVRRGQVARWPVCAMPECEEHRVEAHHADYDNPLGVTWLCAKHHRLAHFSIRRTK